MTVGIIVFHWGDANFKIGDRFGRVSTEIWAGLVTTVGTTYWAWYSEREKDKIKLAQANAAANSGSIKSVSEALQGLVTTLSTRIDSTMLQIGAIRTAANKTGAAVERVEDDVSQLDEKIDQYRYDLLTQRLKMFETFYAAICDLRGEVSYLKGLKDGDRPISVEKLNEILTALTNSVHEHEAEKEEKVKNSKP